MKKRIIALVLAMMCLLLTACSGQKTGLSSAKTEDPAEKTGSAPVETSSTWNVTRPEGLPDGYPNKEITYIYPFGTGSMQDVYIRVLAETIKEKEGWKHGIVVQQKEGASGDIGWSSFMKAKPDGYTIAFAPAAQIITALGLGKEYTPDNLSYIFNMMTDPGAVGVASSSEYETLTELLEAAKEKPGTISIGVTSTTGSEGLAMIQLQKASGARFNIIPFDGEPEVLTAVAGGHCDGFCLNVGDCTTFLEEGTVKLLAVGTPERSQFYPQTPTYQESGYDVVQANSRAIAAPAGTDEAIIQYLSDCFMAAAQDEAVQQRVKELIIPFDSMDHKTCQEMFMSYYKAYKELWESDPWM
ncbi:MAG: tripartite tricarboxylate transporter substrate binding protein [Clostridiales bacterium]